MSATPDVASDSNKPDSPALPPLRATETNEHAAAIRQLVEGETAWDKRLIAWSDWINPILVKETRQALKSRQFSWTLFLLATVILAWSAIAIIGMIPSIYYASNGVTLLIGYSMILILPTMIIIPQAAFRSMASELEDGTFETLSLSTLQPWHILFGKLSVAAIQLTVYLSVIAPCIALTYLLRGVTLETIAISLVLLTTCSLGLSVIAISMASFAKTRMQQVFYSIVLLGIQAVSAFATGSTLGAICSAGAPGFEGWIAIGVFLLIVILYGWLLLQCGACSIGVSSENRSTPIRIPVLCIAMLLSMLMALMIVCFADGGSVAEIVASATMMGMIHWGIAGAIMMGEQGIIPIRARRTLPSTLMARMMFTWLNPGAGPAYLFTVLGFVGCAMPLVIGSLATVEPTRSASRLECMVFVLAEACYVALYVGIIRLVCMFLLRRVQSNRLILAFCLLILLLVMSVIITCMINLASNNYRDLEFDWYCFPNLFWTLGELYPGYSANFLAAERFGALIALMVVSGVVALVNILLTAKDVVLLKIETPARVIKERSRGRDEPSVDEVIDPLAPES